MKINKGIVDIVLNVSGKPYQTIITIHSLLRFSGNYINKLFVIFEKKQAFNDNMQPLLDYLESLDIEVELFYSKLQIGISNLDRKPFFKPFFRFIPFFRHSLRYQYGLEKSKTDWVFVSHNDMIYRKDILQAYLSEIDENMGIGFVGQCWNCPAVGDCSGEKYFEYRPSKEEIFHLYEGKENLRGFEIIRGNYSGWPLPECRINEHAALFDRKMMQSQTYPIGNIEPIGYNSYDIGMNFYAKVSRKGFKFKQLGFHLFAEHAYFNKNRNGHSSFTNEQLYWQEEGLAKEIVEKSIDEFIDSMD